MIEHKHLGVYGLIIKDNNILLIKKNGGPYDGKLDLPGGSIEFGETPETALKREFLEEVGINIKEYELFDANSVVFDWVYGEEKFKWQHIGIFYKIFDYDNEIKQSINIDSKNDDSLGANFYEIDKLNKKDLSLIAVLELEKLGYILE